MNKRFEIKRKNPFIPQCQAIDFEKRRHPRLPFQLPTEYSRVDSASTRFGHTVNICESGILVRLPEKVKMGEKLRVTVYFDMDFGLYNMKALAEVVWLDGLTQKKKESICGLKFLETAAEDLNALEKFIKSFY